MRTIDPFRLEKRVVILTGAAGHYGRTLAAQIAAAGATLWLASRDGKALDELAVELRERGADVHTAVFDQGVESSIRDLTQAVLKKHGRIDGLVNNAVFRPNKAAGAVEPAEAWLNSLKVNAVGLYLLTRTAAESMAETGGGAIVNVASIYGVVGPSPSFYEGTDMKLGLGDYFFNKGGMINLTRYFAAQFGARGVRVNCVSPGGFFNQQPEPFVQRYCQATYLGRMAGPDDLGGPVVFLLSPAAAYVTGVNLPVDGGYTAR
ncbi:MAG TPA: SDR family oxidoreductase [Opitutaceae bacterium]|nr:SDR family oxidoreductase [Opitutaceae bacterium]